MSSSSFFSARIQLKTESDIKESIKRSKDFNSEAEAPEMSHALLYFTTSKQQTWLVATSERLYCILDDVKEAEPSIKWSMAKVELVEGITVKLKIDTRARKWRPNSPHGIVNFGPNHKDWLYTKRLFYNNTIEDRVKFLIDNTMIGIRISNGGLEDKDVYLAHQRGNWGPEIPWSDCKSHRFEPLPGGDELVCSSSFLHVGEEFKIVILGFDNEEEAREAHHRRAEVEQAAEHTEEFYWDEHQKALWLLVPGFDVVGKSPYQNNVFPP